MSIKITQTFNRLQNPPRVQKVEDADRIIGELIRQVNTLVGQLNTMKSEIEAGQQTGDTTVVINTGASSGGSGGGTGASYQIRAKSDSLTAGVTKTVSFSSAMTATFVIPSLRCYNSDGQAVGFGISNITSNSFDVNAMEDATIEYLAIEVT